MNGGALSIRKQRRGTSSVGDLTLTKIHTRETNKTKVRLGSYSVSLTVYRPRGSKEQPSYLTVERTPDLRNGVSETR